MSEHLDEEYWNLRYINHQTNWDIGFPSPAIVKWLDNQQNLDLKILIPGAGLGHEVRYAFHKGFNHIYYMDYADHAIKSFKKRCPNFPEEHILTGDFFNLPLNNYFDIIIEQTFFCAQKPSNREDYVTKIHDLLKSDGKLIGLLFETEFDKDGPPFGGRKSDYQNLFDKKFDILKMAKSNLSIPPREGLEIWIDLLKK